MDLVTLLINLASGAVGGNLAGAALPSDKNLGTLGNTVAGLLGGGLGGYLAQALDLWGKVGATGLDVTSVLAQVGTGGVSGAVLMVIISLIKQAMNKA